VAALEAGELDLIPSRGIPLPRFDALSEQPGLKVVARTGVRVYYLMPDCTRVSTQDVNGGGENPFRDARVRRAVSLAIDRGALAASPDVGGEALDQLVVPEAFGHARDLGSEPHDPERARRLLSEAGFSEGFEATLDIADDSSEVLEGLRRDLADVGIRIRPRLQGIAEILDRARRGHTGLLMLSWIGTAGDLGSTADYLLQTRGDLYGHYNAGGWSDPEADRLIAEARSALDPLRRAQLLHELAGRVREQAPVIPILRNNDRYALRSELRFQPRLDRRILGVDLSWK
jgi:peptide/nickel transport system substrate-binding protein